MSRAATRLAGLLPVLCATALASALSPGSALAGSARRGSALRGSAATQASFDPTAHAARTVYLRELGHLRYVNGNESTLDEHGNASGTFNGSLAARLTISAEHVSAVFTIYPRGGSVTGKAWANFVVRGHTGYYGGTLKIVHGTGAFRHASGANIGISGTIDRYSFALVVKVDGWIKY